MATTWTICDDVPAPLRGVSRLCWLEPRLAMVVMGTGCAAVAGAEVDRGRAVAWGQANVGRRRRLYCLGTYQPWPEASVPKWTHGQTSLGRGVSKRALAWAGDMMLTGPEAGSEHAGHGGGVVGVVASGVLVVVVSSMSRTTSTTGRLAAGRRPLYAHPPPRETNQQPADPPSEPIIPHCGTQPFLIPSSSTPASARPGWSTHFSGQGRTEISWQPLYTHPSVSPPRPHHARPLHPFKGCHPEQVSTHTHFWPPSALVAHSHTRLAPQLGASSVRRLSMAARVC